MTHTPARVSVRCASGMIDDMRHARKRRTEDASPVMSAWSVSFHRIPRGAPPRHRHGRGTCRRYQLPSGRPRGISPPVSLNAAITGLKFFFEVNAQSGPKLMGPGHAKPRCGCNATFAPWCSALTRWPA